jgi:hypothetical protein
LDHRGCAVERVARAKPVIGQKQIYAQLNDLVLDESFVAVVSASPQIMMTSAKVHGLSPAYHASFSFSDAWLDA